jgi:hypothetical protein
MSEYSYAAAISAAHNQNLDELLTTLDKLLRERMVPMDLLIPYAHGELVSLAHTHGFIEEVEHLETGTHLQGRIPLELAGRYAGYWFNPSQNAPMPALDDGSGADDDYEETNLDAMLSDENDDYPEYVDEWDDDFDDPENSDPENTDPGKP